MHRTLLHSVLFSMLTCAFVACGNDQPKSTTDGTSTAQTKTPESKSAAPKKMDAPEAKDATAAAAPKSAETKPAADATKPDAAKTDAAKTEAAKSETPVDPNLDPAIAKMREFIASKNIDKKAPNWRTKVTMPPKLTFDPKKTYYWVLDTTEGPIKVRLMPDIAPMHVSSAIYLTELGFYDTLKFHRVIQGFMAQGGDPLGNGMGGPGYHMDTEISPKVKHSKAGMLSTANSGRPGTDGSQFFLTFKATPFLDGGYTIYGEVVEGLETVKKLESFGAPSDPGTPTKPLQINTAKIVVE